MGFNQAAHVPSEEVSLTPLTSTMDTSSSLTAEPASQGPPPGTTNAAPSPAPAAPVSPRPPHPKLLPLWRARAAIALALAFNIGCFVWIVIRVRALYSEHHSWLSFLIDPLPAEGITTVSVTPVPIFFGAQYPMLATSLHLENNAGILVWKSLSLAIAVTVLTLLEFFVFHVRGDAKRRTAYVGKERSGVQAPTVTRSQLFLLTNRAVFVLCFLPAFLFFAAMILDGEQDAAVFAMALAAILVAAEHYSSLERQSEIAEDQRQDLEVQGRILVKQQETLGRQLGLLRALNAELTINVRSIVAALGKSPAQEEMFRLYSLMPKEKKEDNGNLDNAVSNTAAAAQSDSETGEAPEAAPVQDKPEGSTILQGTGAKEEKEAELTDADRRIYAIFRECFVDNSWWARDWNAFLKDTPDMGHMNLAYALTRGERRWVTIIVPYAFRGNIKDEISFRSFIGLMWHCVLFAKLSNSMREDDKKVRSGLPASAAVASDGQVRPANDIEAPRLRITMADTALWLHVVDRDVHQIVDQPGEQMVVRNLSLNIGKRAIPLADWAKREIHQLAGYGPTAEEFLCTVLCKSDQNIFNDNRLDETVATAILKAVKLRLRVEPDEDWTSRESKCAKLLMEFAEVLHLRQHRRPKPDVTTHLSTSIFTSELE